MQIVTSHTVSLSCLFQRGRTALHFAAWCDHHDIVLDLIKMQANVDVVDKGCVNVQISSGVGFHVYGGQLNVRNICIAKQSNGGFPVVHCSSFEIAVGLLTCILTYHSDFE